MKVVFLDIDGVLNSHEFFQRNKAERGIVYHVGDDRTWIGLLDPACVARLERLVKDHDADVVISSSWRCVNTHTEIAEYLAAKGFTGRVIGATTTSYGLVPDRDTVRGDQIAHWLAAPEFRDGAEVESFVILDDDSDMAHLADRHVKTSWSIGLTDAEVERASALLSQRLMAKP